MKTTYYFYLLLALVLIAIAGCAPSALNVNGNTLYHDSYPRISVSAKAPLELLDAGKVWSSLQCESLTIQPIGSFTYSLYSPTNEGPVNVHAHALIVQPTDTARWAFLLEGYKLLNSIYYNEISRGGHRWTIQILRIQAENDWVSGVWQANRRSVPDLWLAKRFSATPDPSTRVVAEYREAWPSCLATEARDLAETNPECLAGFQQRADAAFSLNETPMPDAPGSAPKLPIQSAIAPDLAALAGRVESYRPSSDGARP